LKTTIFPATLARPSAFNSVKLFTTTTPAVMPFAGVALLPLRAVNTIF
jgi:hypothetical protein